MFNSIINSNTVTKIQQLLFLLFWYFKAVFIAKISPNFYYSMTLAYTLPLSKEKGKFLFNFVNLSIKV